MSSWRKIKIDPADTAFSLYIRLRDKKCQRCSKFGEPDSKGREVMGLDNSHFWSRSHENTRFDPQNCDAMCRYCHEYLGGNPGEYAEWKQKQLGKYDYDRLMIRANTTTKKDRKMSLLYAKELLKEV